MVAETLHITFVVHKLLFGKIRNSRNLKKTFEHRFIETLWHFAKSVSIFKDEKHLIKVALALLLGFGKSGKTNIYQTQLKVKSNVNGANFGLVSFLGIVILVEKIYVM